MLSFLSRCLQRLPYGVTFLRLSYQDHPGFAPGNASNRHYRPDTMSQVLCNLQGEKKEDNVAVFMLEVYMKILSESLTSSAYNNHTSLQLVKATDFFYTELLYRNAHSAMHLEDEQRPDVLFFWSRHCCPAAVHPGRAHLHNAFTTCRPPIPHSLLQCTWRIVHAVCVVWR